MQGQGPAGRSAGDGQEGRLLGQVPRADPGRARGGHPPAADRHGGRRRLASGARQRGGRGLLLLDLQRPGRHRQQRPAEDHGPGRGAQPDRAGHRVRLLLRPRRPRAAGPGHRNDHGQLQSGDGLHRLRHVRQALLRAADRRGRPEHLREGEARRRHRPVRGADSPEPRPGARRRRGQDPRHQPGHHRPGRGPRPVRQDDGRTGHPHARVGHGRHHRRGAGDRRTHRIPADGPPVVRAGRTRDAGGARRGDAPGIRRRGRRRHPGTAHPHRQVS